MAILVVMLSCRKGENDPAFSLASRKSRLAGEWHLQSGVAFFDVNYYEPANVRFNVTYEFDGTSMVENGTYRYPHQLYLEIKKDGTFTFSEILPGEYVNATGEWSFLSASGEEKNKESVLFQITDVQSGSSYSTIFNRLGASFKYRITGLRPKELAIESEGFLFRDDQGQFESLNTEYRFTQ